MWVPIALLSGATLLMGIFASPLVDRVRALAQSLNLP